MGPGDILNNALLTNANLKGADLSCSAGIDQGCSLLNNAVLNGANLSNANLTSAEISNANLNNANLSGANLTGADLYGSNLTGATLSGITWSDTICPDGSNSNSDGGTCAHNLTIG